MNQTPRTTYLRTKRVVDVALSAVALVMAGPLMGVVALVVRRDLGSPVLFRQVRPGLHGEPFELVKFRTMWAPGEKPGAVSDAQRLTAIGRFIRSASLDELPTLWNVLRGDMSLVGPRPLLPEYLDRYTTDQRRRHNVRPGITGLAQVRGRNRLPWDARLALDVIYVDQVGPWLDARIALWTVASVLARRDITAPGSATMPEFRGSGRSRDVG